MKSYFSAILLDIIVFSLLFSQTDLPAFTVQQPHEFRLRLFGLGVGARDRVLGLRRPDLFAGQLGNGRNV